MFWHWKKVTSSFKQKLCGAAWVHSKASKKDMFLGSSGSISSQVCPSATGPISERELIVRAPITTPANTRPLAITSSNEMTCPQCGTFKKSGRVSCCAPGGAWFKNCGGLGKKNVDHTWFEGAKLCKCKSKANAIFTVSIFYLFVF